MYKFGRTKLSDTKPVIKFIALNWKWHNAHYTDICKILVLGLVDRWNHSVNWETRKPLRCSIEGRKLTREWCNFLISCHRSQNGEDYRRQDQCVFGCHATQHLYRACGSWPACKDPVESTNHKSNLWTLAAKTRKRNDGKWEKWHVCHSNSVLHEIWWSYTNNKIHL
jgi:hypothetical protein